MNLDQLLSGVQVDVAGVPYFTALDHLRRAAREFCERTHVWTVTLASFNTAPSITSYALALPDGSSLVRLSRVDVGDQCEVDLLDQEDADLQVKRGSQSYFAWLEGDKLRINPPQTAAVTVVVQLSLKPTIAAESIPDWIAEDHAEAIQAKAKSTLKAMSNVDWSDPLGAGQQEAIFLGRCSAAARQKTKGRASTRRRAAKLY